MRAWYTNCMAGVSVVVYKGSEVEEEVVLDPQELEVAVDEDISAFNEYFQRELKNVEPLLKSEKAVLKTYLWWKAHQEKHDAK